MMHFPRPRASAFLVAIWLTPFWGLQASEGEDSPENRGERPFHDLVERNPFVPPAPPSAPQPSLRPPPATASPSNLRFAGTLRIGGRNRFAVHNKETGKAFWLEEGERVEDLEVIGWDPNGPMLQVRQAGEAKWMELERPQIPVTSVSTEPQRNREMTREERREAWRAAAAERMREARERGEVPDRRRVSAPPTEENGD